MQTVEQAIAYCRTLAEMARHYEPQHPECSAQWEMQRNAESMGMHSLGHGNFSRVYSMPGSPFVIKISLREGDNAIAYAAYCRANPGPHIPRIHHLERLHGYGFMVLDRLTPLDDNGNYDDEFQEASAVLYGNREPETSAGHAAARIREFFLGVSSVDLHGENAMRDDNGVLIITDPLAFTQSAPMLEGIERAYGISAKLRKQKALI